MNKYSSNITTAGLLMACGLVLPMAFHAVGIGGSVFLPMHIPVLLGGFLLSPLFALLVGILTPLLSSVLTGMPPFFPTGVQMLFELGTYGLITSLVYRQRQFSPLFSLLTAMVSGRLIAGIANYLLLTQFLNKIFSLQAFLTAAFVTSIPGIIIQIIMLPAIIILLEKNNLIKGKERLYEGRTQS